MEVGLLISDLGRLNLDGAVDRGPTCSRQKMDLDRPHKAMDWELTIESSPMDLDKRRKKKKKRSKKMWAKPKSGQHILLLQSTSPRSKGKKRRKGWTLSLEVDLSQVLKEIRV